MSKALGMRCVWGLCGVLVSVLALASVARAEVSTDVSGSVLVFPKVIWTGNETDAVPASDRDTVIEISNTAYSSSDRPQEKPGQDCLDPKRSKTRPSCVSAAMR